MDQSEAALRNAVVDPNVDPPTLSSGGIPADVADGFAASNVVPAGQTSTLTNLTLDAQMDPASVSQFLGAGATGGAGLEVLMNLQVNNATFDTNQPSGVTYLSPSGVQLSSNGALSSPNLIPNTGWDSGPVALPNLNYTPTGPSGTTVSFEVTYFQLHAIDFGSFTPSLSVAACSDSVPPFVFSALRTPSSTPSPPTIGSAGAVNGSALVSFTPGTDGGSTVLHFDATCTSSDGGATGTASGGSSPLAVSGLTNGDMYTCSVTATNTVGTSGPSSTSNVVVPSPAPIEVGQTSPGATRCQAGGPGPYDTVQNATASSSPDFVIPSAGALTTWSTQAGPDGGVLELEVWRPTGVTDTYDLVGISPQETLSPNSLNSFALPSPIVVMAGDHLGFRQESQFLDCLTITGNPADQWHTNHAGSGVPVVGDTELLSQQADGFINVAANLDTAPNPPTIGAVTAGNGVASVAFMAGSDGGSTVLHFDATCTSLNGGATGSASGSSSPIMVSALTNGDLYMCTVTATNGIGTSLPSAATNSFVPSAAMSGSPPAVPTIGIASAGNRSATITFTPGSPRSGSFVSYGATCKSLNGGIDGSVIGTGSPIGVSGLTNGKRYTCTVFAWNTYGTSEFSAPSNIVVPTGVTVTVPSAPRHPSAVRSKGKAIVRWTKPLSNGGSAITGYVVTPFLGGVALPARTFNSSATKETITGLTRGKTYTFTVAATNARGTGPPSVASNSITPT